MSILSPIKTAIKNLTILNEIFSELNKLRKLVESQQPNWMEKLQRDNCLSSITKTSQLLLQNQYKLLHIEGKSMPSLADVEFRCNSQNGEDGIIHYVFSVVGAGPKKAVEICAGHGIECNSANLIINHGWDALLFDGDEDNISRGQEFYRTCQDTFSRPPTIIHAWITAENVDALISEHGYVGEVGLLSIDIDGMDYWIWKAIQGISPRLVLIEFNPVWGPDMSVAVPYNTNFRIDYNKTPYYCSASLAAYCKLAEEKGYRLIGVQRLGFNAFFLRKDLGQDVIPTVSPAECFRMSPALQGWNPNWIPSAVERPEFITVEV